MSRTVVHTPRERCLTGACGCVEMCDAAEREAEARRDAAGAATDWTTGQDRYERWLDERGERGVGLVGGAVLTALPGVIVAAYATGHEWVGAVLAWITASVAVSLLAGHLVRVARERVEVERAAAEAQAVADLDTPAEAAVRSAWYELAGDLSTTVIPGDGHAVTAEEIAGVRTWLTVRALYVVDGMVEQLVSQIAEREAALAEAELRRGWGAGEGR